jgi:hypothetical protein
MKVVFLDIDGVLALPKQFHTNRDNLWKRDRHAYGLGVPYMFDEKCVIAFNRFLLMNAEMNIVLSSDWRKHFSQDTCDLIFKINGVAKSPISFTPQLPPERFGESPESIRVREIREWLLINTVATWCAVDDTDLSELGSRFIQTDYRMGFGQNGFIEKAERCLYPPYDVNN